MLFTRFKETAQKYFNKLALNTMTYGELLALVESECGGGVLVDILRASRLNKPCVILPHNKIGIELPQELPDEFCLVLWSSGTSGGNRKPVILTETMLIANANNSIKCNEITPIDVIYTVCSMKHTGGINAQSLPALLAGAHVVVESFNAFSFFRRIGELEATITHLVPRMMTALNQVDWRSVPTLKTVMCGSDCVEKWHVEFFINRGCGFIINYGLTEAGPIIINHHFKQGDDLSVFNYGVPLGTKAWCETVFTGRQLGLIGEEVKYGCILTGDCVFLREGWFMYEGRVNAGCKIIPKAY
jgi:hypothetical protein